MDQTPLFNDTVGVMAVILMIPIFFLWLERKTRWKIFEFLPAIIWIFLTPIFLSNFGIIPRSTPIYTTFKAFAVPLFIVLMLLDIDIREAMRVAWRSAVVMVASAVGIGRRDCTGDPTCPETALHKPLPAFLLTVLILSLTAAVAPAPAAADDTGTLKIVNNSVRDDAQDFSFTVAETDGPFIESFELDDDDDATLPAARSFSLAPGTYSAEQPTVPPGWTLKSMTCSDESPIDLIDVGPGETVTCTFTNIEIPVFTNDAVVLGILMVILGFVFWSSSTDRPFWKKFYTYVPSLLVCYFLPSLLSTAGLISGDLSNLYFVSSRYLLPTSLVLLTLSIDYKGILNLGPKALIMFLTGTFGIVVGGPIAILIGAWINPEMVGGAGPDAVWRGMTTVAGSWIGGGANQTAMKEVFGVGDDIFSAWVAVDVIVANIWMAVLLFAAGRSEAIDRRTGADASAIVALRERVSAYQASIAKLPKLSDTMLVAAVGFGVTAIAHVGADSIAPYLAATAPYLDRFSLTNNFFWIVVIATTLGMILAATKARGLEGVGASRVGSALLYVLIASIGMKMNLMAILEEPAMFLIGGIWMVIHASLMIVVAKLIKAPVFFMAVGSQANVGGAASAPIVASAFHPSLASVGVLLAVLGYALGTYAAWFCGQLMRIAAP